MYVMIESFKGYVFLFLAFTLAGTSVIAARLVSGNVGTFTITVVSLFFAVVSLTPFIWRRLVAVVKRLNERAWLMLLFQAVFGIFLFRFFLLQGLLQTSAGEAGIMTGAAPAMTTVLAWLMLKEPAGRHNIAGIILTTAGVLLVQGILSGNEIKQEHVWGNLLVLCAAGCESLFNVLSRMNHLKSTAKHQSIDPAVQALMVSGIAMLLCLIPALFEQPFSSLKALDWQHWLSLVWYGTVVTALAFICWYAGIKRQSAYAAAAFSGMMPLTSMILAVIVLGESVDWQQWTGCALVMLGMMLIGLRRTSKSCGVSEADSIAA